MNIENMTDGEARRMILLASAWLAAQCADEASLEARNLHFAAEQYMAALDAYFQRPGTENQV